MGIFSKKVKDLETYSASLRAYLDFWKTGQTPEYAKNLTDPNIFQQSGGHGVSQSLQFNTCLVRLSAPEGNRLNAGLVEPVGLFTRFISPIINYTIAYDRMNIRIQGAGKTGLAITVSKANIISVDKSGFSVVLTDQGNAILRIAFEN